jgi:hypothetical protein
MLLVLMVLEVMLHTKCCMHGRRHVAAGKLMPRLGSSTMVVLLFFMPWLQRTLFGMFACIPLDQPAVWPYEANAVGSFWVYDTSNVCFGPGWHRCLAFGLGVPLIALLCIGLPAAIVYVTMSNFSNLGDISFRRSWGVFYALVLSKVLLVGGNGVAGDNRAASNQWLLSVCLV